MALRAPFSGDREQKAHRHRLPTICTYALPMGLFSQMLMVPSNSPLGKRKTIEVFVIA